MGVYALLAVGAFYFPYYTAFLAGIIAADIYVNSRFKVRAPSVWAVVGLAIGCTPYLCLPPWLNRAFSYGIGAFLLLIGCCFSQRIQKLLSPAFLVRWGKLSFSLILTHFIVLQSVSAGLFVFLAGQGLPFALNLSITALVSVPVLGGSAIAFYQVFEAGYGKLFKNLIDKLSKS